MFGFLKNKSKKQESEKLYAPVDGKVIPLSQVEDPVFSQKMAGDGVAIEPTSDTIVSPADGTLELVFNTKHAFALKLDNGAEILVHIGLETVSLNGESFTQLAEVGSKVKVGTPIIKIDRDFIKGKGCSLVTPILITNPDSMSSINTTENIDAVAGQTAVIEYTV